MSNLIINETVELERGHVATDLSHLLQVEKPLPEWKRRQQIQTPAPRQLVPTLHQTVARLSPNDRHALMKTIGGMKLRKAIQRTLATAYHRLPAHSIFRASDAFENLNAAIEGGENDGRNDKRG